MGDNIDRYSHGHHESVLRSHRWRTAENSAGFLLPHLARGMSLLDVGCGPGNITADLADRLAPGAVTGVDASAVVISAAAGDHVRDNLTFATGDVYALDFADDTFDVVFAHQVLQHLGDPVAALREMRRVVRPAGTVAVRDSDYGAFVWSPADPRLTRWMSLYHQLTEHNRAEADAGRVLHVWARQAGFTDVRVSTSNWTFQTADERAWWGGLWADRVQQSEFARQTLEYGLTDEAELAAIGAAFREWAANPDGLFIVLHGEVLATG
jgi:ubiquinone/menaquinone biosynthesis C-methylase UbiE